MNVTLLEAKKKNRSHCYFQKGRIHFPIKTHFRFSSIKLHPPTDNLGILQTLSQYNLKISKCGCYKLDEKKSTNRISNKISVKFSNDAISLMKIYFANKIFKGN